MLASGVTRLKRRREDLVLSGRVRPRTFDGAPRSIALRLGGLTLAETIPVRDADDAPGRWTFHFILSAGLEAILSQGAGLSVIAGAVELPFSPKVQALRSAISLNLDLVREVGEKLRDGFVLTSKGELLAPFAKRGAGLAALLDHYDHCDRLTHEIIGRHLHVVGGTFLGAARQGGAIDHDIDFDAAYLSDARDAMSVRSEYLEFLRALVRRGETVLLVNQRGHIRRRHFKWRSNGERRPGSAPITIDIFPAFIDEQDFYCRPTFVRIPGGEPMILPLRRIPFGDRDVWAPNQIVEKAAGVFGPSWRVPDPFWTKPDFPGVAEALAGLRLTDDDLLALAAEMPASRSDSLREAIAAEAVRTTNRARASGAQLVES